MVTGFFAAHAVGIGPPPMLMPELDFDHWHTLIHVFEPIIRSTPCESEHHYRYLPAWDGEFLRKDGQRFGASRTCRETYDLWRMLGEMPKSTTRLFDGRGVSSSATEPRAFARHEDDDR